MVWYAENNNQQNWPEANRVIARSAYLLRPVFLLENRMKLIPLTQGKHTLVDDEDYGWLMLYKWHACHIRGQWYAIGAKGRMHRFIMNCPKAKEIDHIDGNTLNNQKYNLRICTHAENCQNRKANKKGSSRYKGVSWFCVIKKWQVKICHNGKSIFLGYYGSEAEAAKAYDKKAQELDRLRNSRNFD